MHLGNDSFSRIASSASIRSDVTHIICPSSHGNNVFAGPGQGPSPVPPTTTTPPTPRAGQRKRPSSPGEYCFRQSVVRFRPARTPGLGHTHPRAHPLARLYIRVSRRVVSHTYLLQGRARLGRFLLLPGRRVISPIFPAAAASSKRITRGRSADGYNNNNNILNESAARSWRR